MIDINKIRNDKDKLESSLLKKTKEVNLDNIIKLDQEKRKIGTSRDEKKNQRNIISKEIPKLAKEEKEIKIKEMQELGEEIEKLDSQYNDLDEKIFDYIATLPNVPDDDVQAGGKENNQVIYTYSEKPKFDFEPKDHVEIATDLKLIDYERGVKLAGTGSWIYTGLGARLEWALINFFIDEHINDGWEFMLVPHMLKQECGFTAGQFPKFQDEVYWIDGGYSPDGRFILPTAETALVNVHRDETLSANELPKKYFAYTPCYRREAGTSRIEERGTVRGHQFDKVEMVEYTENDKSDVAFEEMMKKAETLMQKLGLHYQVSKLAAEDCSASMARTYDIEVWIPSMGIYKEVSSVSNARDYQARRGNMKYKDQAGNTKYMNTLNGSGLATSRLMPAILEQYQQKDGSVVIPEVLRKYMGKLEKICK